MATPNGKIHIAAILTPEDVEQVRRVAREHKRSVSSLIQVALAEWIARHAQPEKKEHRNGQS